MKPRDAIYQYADGHRRTKYEDFSPLLRDILSRGLREARTKRPGASVSECQELLGRPSVAVPVGSENPRRARWRGRKPGLEREAGGGLARNCR